MLPHSATLGVNGIERYTENSDRLLRHRSPVELAVSVYIAWVEQFDLQQKTASGAPTQNRKFSVEICGETSNESMTFEGIMNVEYRVQNGLILSEIVGPSARIGVMIVNVDGHGILCTGKVKKCRNDLDIQATIVDFELQRPTNRTLVAQNRWCLSSGYSWEPRTSVMKSEWA